MKKEYDLNKMKRRDKKPKADSSAAKTPISLRVDGAVLSDLKTEAEQLGIPYQTLINSILYRYTAGELKGKKAI